MVFTLYVLIETIRHRASIRICGGRIYVDYCNSFLSLMRAKHLHLLQSALNAAARVTSRRNNYDHVSDVIRNQLHWHPIIQIIEYKLCSLVFKCLHQSVPNYLSEMRQFVSDMPGRRNLRSAAHGHLV